MTVTWLSPGAPDQRTGGYLWNARIAAELRASGTEVEVIAVDGRWPQLDPATTRWSAARVRARPIEPEWAPWVDALLGGPLPAGPDPVPAAEVEPRRAAVRDGVERGGVLPPALELWALGSALPGHGPPIARIGLPAWRLWLGCAGPLAGWLRGDPADARVRDALVLAVGAGAGPVLVDGAPTTEL
ncbi:MAG: hypothetical protein ABMA64_30550 [Myxococcota bacterium]